MELIASAGQPARATAAARVHAKAVRGQTARADRPASAPMSPSAAGARSAPNAVS